jgi:hypothetical protein
MYNKEHSSDWLTRGATERLPAAANEKLENGKSCKKQLDAYFLARGSLSLNPAASATTYKTMTPITTRNTTPQITVATMIVVVEVPPAATMSHQVEHKRASEG